MICLNCVAIGQKSTGLNLLKEIPTTLCKWLVPIFGTVDFVEKYRSYPTVGLLQHFLRD